MAEMLPGFTFTGTIANIVAYKRKGSDRIFLRSKGGPSKSRIKTHPKFEVTRRNNFEFGGRSTAVKWIMKMFYSQKALADYNVAGYLNALIKPIQALDTESEHGQRNIYFTKNPKLLEGFNLNKQNPFDSIVRYPLTCSVSRDTISARIDIPALKPGINFFVPGRYPMFSFVASLGMMPDLIYKDKGYKLSNNYEAAFPIGKVTEWFACMKGSPALSMELRSEHIPPGNDYSLMLSIGIRFGTMDTADSVQQIKHAGAAKVLRME